VGRREIREQPIAAATTVFIAVIFLGGCYRCERLLPVQTHPSGKPSSPQTSIRRPNRREIAHLGKHKFNHESHQFFVVGAEREDAGRFIAHATDMPTAFYELQAAIPRELELG
jgi:hypothetical protein